MRACRAAVAAAAMCLFACRAPGAPPAEVAVRLDPGTRYQTILGWGKTTPWQPVDKRLRALTLERAVDDFGINRLRFEGVCGNSTERRSFEWVNDDADPRHIHWPGFNTAAIDSRAEAWLVPWKQAVEARGEPFEIYVSPSFFAGGSTGDAPRWLLADPEEYAEWAAALLLRLRDEHGLRPQWYSICNEAGNNNAFTPEVVARLIPPVMARFAELGLPARIQYAECVNAQVAVRYLEAIRDRADLWPHLGLLSYHWYGRDNQAAMARIREVAVQRGLPTAQTEFMDLTIDHLYDDLVIGGVSYWEVYGLCTPDFEAALAGASSATFGGGPWYWRFRQVSHYVRPGAVRIAADSADPALRVLAFEHGGLATTVLINTTPPQVERTVEVAGLAPGRIGVSQAVGRRPFRELGPRTVGADGRLRVVVPADSVLTIYPRSTENLPPTVNAWEPEPRCLHAPAAAVRLTAEATDPDGDPLRYAWSVVSSPAGARPALERAETADARAVGLSLSGEYVFAVAVSDGRHTVRRELLVRAFAANQPPVPMDVHNRIPVQPRAHDGNTLLRAGAWDVEGDALGFRWAVVRQPDGASASLETPDQAACKVSGMRVAGDYVFALTVRDAAHAVTVEHTVTVLP